MAYTPRPKPSFLDTPTPVKDNLESLATLMSNADRMFQELYQDLGLVAADIAALGKTVTASTGVSTTLKTQALLPWFDTDSGDEPISLIPGPTGPQGLQGLIGAPGLDGDISGDEPNLSIPPGGISNLGGPFTKGSVIFAGPSGALAQDNAKFFWKDSSLGLGIGTNTPVSNIGLPAFVDCTDSGSAGAGFVFHTPANSAQECAIFGAGIGLFADAVGAATASGFNKIYFRTTDVNSSYTGKIRLSIEHDGTLAFGNTGSGDDNLYNIGQVSSGRPKNLYLGTGLQLKNSLAAPEAININWTDAGANTASISSQTNGGTARNFAITAAATLLLGGGGSVAQWLVSTAGVLEPNGDGAFDLATASNRVGAGFFKNTVQALLFQTMTALVALGGGAAATLGTIGGSGPATAAQNTWLKMTDSTGASFWVPAWK